MADVRVVVVTDVSADVSHAPPSQLPLSVAMETCPQADVDVPRYDLPPMLKDAAATDRPVEDVALHLALVSLLNCTHVVHPCVYHIYLIYCIYCAVTGVDLCIILGAVDPWKCTV